MSVFLLDPASNLSVRVAAALMFGAAAYGKCVAPAKFFDTLRDYRLLPAWAVAPGARAVPVVEAAVAIALPLNVLLPYAALAGAALLAVFGGAMAINLRRGRTQIDCGCSLGQSGGHRLRWHFVARNAGLAMLLLTCSARTRLSASEMVIGIIGGAALFLVLEAVNTLWALRPASTMRAS